MQAIEHRLIKPQHPQTNGLVERFNGRISDLLATSRFRSCEDVQTALERNARHYNDHLPQRALGHHTPRRAIEQWRKEHPEMFASRLKNQPGLNTYAEHDEDQQPL